jgi:hypothetical protein
MISIQTLAIGTPVAAFLIIGLLAFAEYRWIESGKRREQLAMAGREKLSGGGSAQSAANPDAAGAVKTQTAAE